MRANASHWQKEPGRRDPVAQALVEFALALPIFLLVVYGLLEAGRLIYAYAAVTTASREAVRYASAWGVNTAGKPQYQDCAGIRNAAKNVGFLLNLADTDITIQYDIGTNTTLHSYCAPGTSVDTSANLQSGYRVAVNVRYHFSPILPFFLPFTQHDIASGPSRRTILGVIDLNKP